MGVGSGEQRGHAPLDFHTGYRYSRQRLNSAIFRSFLLFLVFFNCPPYMEIFLPTPLAPFGLNSPLL